MTQFKLKSFSFILSVLILGGFYSYGLLAWTGPTSAPPGSNAPTPVNIGTADQEKAGRLSATAFYDAADSSFYVNPSGDSKISGTLSLGGDLYDVTNSKKIYDSTTGKFDPSVMPYEKGDLTSDWATSAYTTGYYTAVSAANVKTGVGFGRGLTGTLFQCAVGTATVNDVNCGKTADVDCDGVAESGTRCSTGSCTSCQSGSCQIALASNYCASHSGAITVPNCNNAKIFCADNKMWSVTDAGGHLWNPADIGVCTDACNYCSNLTYAGFSDWYLPSKDVLLAVVGDIGLCPANGGSCGSWDPHCCTSSATNPYYYWSSTEYNSYNAWYVGFDDGNAYTSSKSHSFSVRCVRP